MPFNSHAPLMLQQHLKDVKREEVPAPAAAAPPAQMPRDPGAAGGIPEKNAGFLMKGVTV